MTGAAPLQRFTAALWLLAGAVVYLSFGYTEMAGSDLWWHLAAGREIVQTGTLWLVDDWSFTAHGDTWLNHEWLADVIYYAWASTWGVESLAYWKWLVVILTFVGLQLALGRESGSAAAGFLCAALALAVAAPFIDVRPHLYSLLNFSILLLLVLGRRAPLWALVLLFLVWVNLHGGFFFGLMALAILIFPWRNLQLDTFRSALLIGLACTGAAALNPSGLKTFLYPLAYAFDAESPFRQLGEWLSPFERGGIRSPLFFKVIWCVPVVAGAYLLPRVRKACGVPWEGILLCLLTLAMAVTSRRFVVLFGMSFAVMLAPLLALVLRRLEASKYCLGLALVALLFAGYRLAPYPLRAGPAFHYLTAEYSYPIDMLDMLVLNDFEGDVFALYNWGGYVHWRTDGALRVFIDGRADTVYGDATYNQYVHVLQGSPGWVDVVESSGAEFFLWPTSNYAGPQRFEALMSSGNWRVVYQDAVSYLLARTDIVVPEQLRALPGTPYGNLSIAQLSSYRGETARAMEYARKVREVLPYQRDACLVLAGAHRQLGQTDQAAAVMAECRALFPSRTLR